MSKTSTPYDFALTCQFAKGLTDGSVSRETATLLPSGHYAKAADDRIAAYAEQKDLDVPQATARLFQRRDPVLMQLRDAQQQAEVREARAQLGRDAL